ncbi:MAG: hypothetical protein ACOCSM_01525 [Bacillota bacterium]
MKRILFLSLTVAMTLVLSACNSYRFEEKESTDYADEYTFDKVYFIEQTTLKFLSDIKEYKGEDDPYEEYPNQDLKIIYGAIDGEDHFLFVPHNDDWDVELMKSPFPSFEMTLEASKEYDEQHDDVPSLTFFSDMVCTDCDLSQIDDSDFAEFRITTTQAFPRSEGVTSMAVDLLEEDLSSNIVILIGQLSENNTPRLAFLGMLENGNVGVIAINPPATEAFTVEYEFSVED